MILDLNHFINLSTSSSPKTPLYQYPQKYCLTITYETIKSSTCIEMGIYCNEMEVLCNEMKYFNESVRLILQEIINSGTKINE